jgi:tetratricopeptide (TPR) repeat protein
MKTIVTIFLNLCFLNAIIAQESCSEKLFRANQLYEKGQLNEALEIANSCLQKENSTSDRWQAYRLLAMVYLATGEQDEARNAAEEMLQINPKYEPSKVKDPVELVKLLKGITIIPKFTFGLATSIGGNITFVNVSGSYNGAEYTKDYTSKASWQAGVTSGYNWNEIISLQSGIIASSNKYNVDYSAGNWHMQLEERLIYLMAPLYARFKTKEEIKGFRFFSDVGGYIGFLSAASTDISRKNEVTMDSKVELDLDAKQRRNKMEYGLLAGVGTIKKIGPINLALDIRYYFSYANITNKGNRYNNSNLLYGYYYIDDDLRLNNLAISLSFIYSVNYKVIKLQ